MNIDQAKREEPRTLTIAVNELMDEVMSNSSVSVKRSKRVLKLLERTDEEPSMDKEMSVGGQLDVKQPSFVDLINKATNEIRVNRMAAIENFNEIEAILK